MGRSTPSLPPAVSRPSVAAGRILLLWAVLFSAASAAAQLPYNPTTILHNGSIIYVFQPSSSSSSQFELASVDISSRIESSDLPLTTLYPTLPFLDSDHQKPFNAILGNGGNITVYTGDCASGASGGQLWSFTPETSEKSGNGSWSQEDITFAQDGKHVTGIGPNYLSAGMSFSAIVDGDAMDAEAYFFGGMCPSEVGDNADWQANANYSNYMVTLEPSDMTSDSLKYDLGSSNSRGPPIAEAGFTLTGLSPSYSNRSDGTQTQQQNFVLVGGHTSSAFINTSQVALFSLPQQGWTFVPVNQPDTSRTDLAIRADVSTVESRSGHSTILSPDGQRLIVFGGWIGDVNTPADPQLAILNIGDGYGGNGNWEWTVPSTTGSGLPSGTGLYGHGAAMLPGGVMMIMGGYSISGSNTRRRRASSRVNQQPMFFNVTSHTWTTDYAPPTENQTEEPAKSGPLATAGQKAGLGAGLGIGMAAVLSLMAFYIWYNRKLKRKRQFRESQLQELAMSAHRYTTLPPGFDSRIDQAGYFNISRGSYSYPSSATQSNASWKQTNAHDAERKGLLVEIPSPTRGLRRNMNGRPNHAMGRYDVKRGQSLGNIHPIDEEEEQEQEVTNDQTPLTSQTEMRERSSERGHSIFNNAPVLDPFVDQHRLPGNDSGFHSAPTSPSDDRDDSHSWQAVAGAYLPGRSSPTNHGRVSPSKSSERTGSNLSERSTRSNLTSHSGSVSLGRSASLRSAAILHHAVNANPFKTPDASPITDNRDSNPWIASADPRTHSLTSIRSSGRPATANADADSFTTARSSFMALKAEGEALLGGNPERTRPGTSSTSNGSSSQSNPTEGSLTRAGTITAATSLTEGFPRRRRMSWLGSVRKALARTTSTTDRTRSLTAATMQFESYTDTPNPEPVQASRVTENRRSLPASIPPRRAASDASFWRSKRGKQDWLDDALDPSDPLAKWKRNAGDDWGTPEDLALAEKERLRSEWRERSNLLVNLSADDDRLPTPSTPIGPGLLGAPWPAANAERPRTPADETDWDVEAAVERRVVQVMFTVPKSKLRVVNADVDRSSILSLARETSNSNSNPNSKSNSQEDIPIPEPETPQDSRPSPSGSRVRDLAGKFEQLSSPSPPLPASRASPQASPRPSPSPSIKSVKLRGKTSAASFKGKAKTVDA